MNLKGRIILVDDEQENLDYNSVILEKEGYEVKTAHNANETFELLAHYKADILLLDIVLKNESGLDILKKIKLNDQYEHLIVIMITGQLKSPEQQATGLEMGADGYITRPVEKREFIARINAFMRHRRTVIALKKSEERFRKIIHRNPDAILIVEQDGSIKFVNEAAENLFKLSADILLTRMFGYPLVIGEHTEINIVRHDDENVFGEMRTIDIDWDDTDTFLTSIRNISDKKKLWDELIKAKDKAEESERLKSAFLANMSHEIRTPMNSIVGFIELLNEKEVSKDQQEVFLKAIRNGSDRLLNTINDIIEISRIEAGYTTVNLTQVSLHKVVNSVVDLLRPDAERKNLQIIINNNNSEEAGEILTDLSKLESILTNLIKNAIKFTFEGSIIIGYSLRETDIEFFIKDTGVGIKKEKLESVFNRFIRVDDDINRNIDGSGLGLAISKAYCNLLGGDIKVDSTFGTGTTFTFTIKRNNIKPTNIVDSARPDNNFKVEGKTILVVEDEESNYDYLNILLTNKNNKVLWAHNGVEAIQIFNTSKLDLILMDLRMPIMDGFKATEEIKKINSKIPIIAQTAYALSGDRDKALEAGCDDYISKPILKDDLFKIMNRHLT